MKKSSCTDRVRNEEVLYRDKKERNVVHTIKRRKATWICYLLNLKCLLKHISEGKIGDDIEVTERRGKRRKQLLDYLQETRRYLKLIQNALDHSLWGSFFGRGIGPVVNKE
jgi:hypothetical protein